MVFFCHLQLMAAEKKARQEVDELKIHIKKLQEAERRERRKLADEDAMRKIKKMEETIAELQKNLANQKQVHLLVPPSISSFVDKMGAN